MTGALLTAIFIAIALLAVACAGKAQGIAQDSFDHRERTQ